MELKSWHNMIKFVARYIKYNTKIKLQKWREKKNVELSPMKQQLYGNVAYVEL